MCRAVSRDSLTRRRATAATWQPSGVSGGGSRPASGSPSASRLGQPASWGRGRRSRLRGLGAVSAWGGGRRGSAVTSTSRRRVTRGRERHSRGSRGRARMRPRVGLSLGGGEHASSTSPRPFRVSRRAQPRRVRLSGASRRTPAPALTGRPRGAAPRTKPVAISESRARGFTSSPQSIHSESCSTALPLVPFSPPTSAPRRPAAASTATPTGKRVSVPRSRRGLLTSSW